jgi:hypothetical protein
MNKEIVIHVIVGLAATLGIYWLWKRNQAGQTVTLPGVGAMTWDQYMQNPGPLAPWDTTGVSGSGNAGWTGAGTDDPYLPPDFTFN